MIAQDIRHMIIDELVSVGRVDWMIVRHLHGVDDGDLRLEFNLFDDWRGRDLPLGRHQGFIKFVGASYDDVAAMIDDVYEYVKDDDMAVANLWILARRINMEEDDCLLEHLKQRLPEWQRRRVSEIITSSAVSVVYGGENTYPTTVNGWLRLQSVYASNVYDLAYSIVELVREDRTIDIDTLFKLPPSLIGALVFFGGYRLSLTPADALKVTEPRCLSLLCALALT